MVRAYFHITFGGKLKNVDKGTIIKYKHPYIVLGYSIGAYNCPCVYFVWEDDFRSGNYDLLQCYADELEDAQFKVIGNVDEKEVTSFLLKQKIIGNKIPEIFSKEEFKEKYPAKFKLKLANILTFWFYFMFFYSNSLILLLLIYPHALSFLLAFIPFTLVIILKHKDLFRWEHI